MTKVIRGAGNGGITTPAGGGGGGGGTSLPTTAAGAAAGGAAAAGGGGGSRQATPTGGARPAPARSTTASPRTTRTPPPPGDIRAINQAINALEMTGFDHLVPSMRRIASGAPIRGRTRSDLIDAISALDTQDAAPPGLTRILRGGRR